MYISRFCLCIVIYNKVHFPKFHNEQGKLQIQLRQRKTAKSGMKRFPADSSGMLIPKNTSLPPSPPPPAVRNAAAAYNWLQDGAREDERMRERWSDKKRQKKERCERGDMVLICSAVVRLHHRDEITKAQRRRRNYDFQFSV